MLYDLKTAALEALDSVAVSDALTAIEASLNAVPVTPSVYLGYDGYAKKVTVDLHYHSAASEEIQSSLPPRYCPDLDKAELTAPDSDTLYVTLHLPDLSISVYRQQE